MKCVITGDEYTIFGYKAKQVRDNIHSADLVRAFDEYFRAPRPAEVYNMGGGRFSNCSMIEAIAMCEEIAGRKLTWKYVDQNRIGDHIWYISDLTRFQTHYPQWKQQYDIRTTLQEIFENQSARYATTATRISA
jgi:CDP-paratose 2-epimerase